MRTTITQLDSTQLEADWPKLIDHVHANGSEFVLLPEMVFSDWLFTEPEVDTDAWEEAIRTHKGWLTRLPELGAQVIAGTAPRVVNGKKLNSAFTWTTNSGIQWHHDKTYLPNEEMFWESKWYDRAAIDFRSSSVDGIHFGFMICSELWFMQHARTYALEGVHLILNPRCTDINTNEKWLTGGRTAGIVAGSFCLSSNRAGRLRQLEFGGAGWISSPNGDVLAVTSSDEPFVTLDLDLSDAESAKNCYPRYIDDSEVL